MHYISGFGLYLYIQLTSDLPNTVKETKKTKDMTLL